MINLLGEKWKTQRRSCLILRWEVKIRVIRKNPRTRWILNWSRRVIWNQNTRKMSLSRKNNNNNSYRDAQKINRICEQLPKLKMTPICSCSRPAGNCCLVSAREFPYNFIITLILLILLIFYGILYFILFVY